jgi:hypothetical protein
MTHYKVAKYLNMGGKVKRILNKKKFKETTSIFQGMR